MSKTKVSILVFVDVALKEKRNTPDNAILIVSILVFVDVALKENFEAAMKDPAVLFQSLFSWMSL